MNSNRLVVVSAVLAAFVLLPLSSALAQDNEAFIKYRQKVMGSIGANMGGIGDILKEGLPYGDHIAGHAANINASAKQIVAAFKKELSAGPTDAKAKIWTEFDKFSALVDDLQAESAKLMKVAAGGDKAAIGEQVKALGKTCGACHKPYRNPKEESYKNK